MEDNKDNPFAGVETGELKDLPAPEPFQVPLSTEPKQEQESAKQGPTPEQLEKIQAVLRNSGADSNSQKKAMAEIKSIVWGD